MTKYIISKKLLKDNENINETAFNFIRALDKNISTSDYCNWLNNELSTVPVTKRKKIIDCMVSKNKDAFYEAVGEIIHIALWNMLKWKFEKDPLIAELTPDFKIILNNQRKLYFLCDVTAVRHNQPHSTNIWDDVKKCFIVNGKSVDKLPLITAPIQQEHRIMMKIMQKYNKYKDISMDSPFVVSLYISGALNSFYLSDFQIKNGLFGKVSLNFSTGEITHIPKIINTNHSSNVPFGIFAFEDYKQIAAVIICREEYYNEPFEQKIGDNNVEYWKAKHNFGIYVNPYGYWARKNNNPFYKKGFPFNGAIDDSHLQFQGTKDIYFY